MNFSQALNPNLIKVGLESLDKEDLFCEMTQILVDNYPSIEKETIVSEIWERERQMSSAVMTNVAIPHCRISGIDEALVCIGVSKKGIDYGALDSEPVILVILIVAPEKGSESLSELFSNLSKIIKNDEFFEQLLQLNTSEEVYNLIVDYENKL